MREQAFAGQRFFDRLRRCRRFDHAIMAARARVLGAHRFNDDEARRVVFEFLGDGFTDARFRVATGALLVVVGHVDLDALPRQMRRQWTTTARVPTRMSAHGRVAGIHLNRLGHRAWFVGELFECELQLTRIDALRLLAK